MPSLMQTMDVSPTVFVPERRNCKTKPSFIMVDNALGAQDAVLTINDIFLPSPSKGALVPVLQTIPRLGINVSQLSCISLEDILKDLEFLGIMSIVIATPDGGCRITVGWDYI